jgi:uncharacterized protein YecE (DUF72 family)
MNTQANIYIGTSGWHYKHWKGLFYPDKLPAREYMSHYLRYFQSVEINNSFYRLPSEATFSAWKGSVPDDFVFAVKASRFITHMKKLNEPEQSIARFMHAVNFLEEKLGPILFQLPPFWNLNLERLKAFLEALPRGYRYALELRNESWYNEAVYQLLEQYEIAFCIYELERHLSPMLVTAGFVYVRLHGPGNKYEGSYTEEALQAWGVKVKGWQQEGKDVYIYFDNDQFAYAAHNAIRLRELVQEGH